MERKGDDINISFLPAAANVITVHSEQVEETSSDISSLSSTEEPTFGPRPDT